VEYAAHDFALIKVLVEDVRAGCAQFRPRRRSPHEYAFRQEAPGLQRTALSGRYHISFLDWPRAPKSSRNPLRSLSRFWPAAFPVRDEANVCNFLGRRCNDAVFWR